MPQDTDWLTQQEIATMTEKPNVRVLDRMISENRID